MTCVGNQSEREKHKKTFQQIKSELVFNKHNV